MSLLHISLSATSSPPRNLSFSWALMDPNPLFLRSRLSHLSLDTPSRMTPIRMGGGPRTYPGGVSKWQWKKMQAKKAKQLLKARLCRERQIYEMRKRAELKAAVSELERPWELVERAPTLFSMNADEQVKVLADRFQRPGGFDMWSEKDGPQLFETVDEVPSVRFFPKGVVHSIKPYGRITDSSDEELSIQGLGSEAEHGVQRSRHKNHMKSSRNRLKAGSSNEGEVAGEELSLREGSSDTRTGTNPRGKFSKKGNKRRFASADSNGLNFAQVGPGRESRGKSGRDGSRFRRGNGSEESKDLDSDVYGLSVQQDGSYGF